MTDITELTPEAARESGSILIIVAARMARREFFTPLHGLCESGKRVVSTRALRDAVERAEERVVSQVSKIVDGHDRLTKKLKEAESRNAELVQALEKAQAKATQQGNIASTLFDEVTQLRRHADEKAPELRAQLIEADSELEALRQRIAELESSGIAPGILRCTECSFVQTKNIISVTAETITTGNSESEPCPNGCGQLQPVTWKALAIQLMFTTKQGVSDLLEAKKRIAELESFRTAYMEWSDKTDWVNTDRRFGVVKPLGKHRADVLKAFIEHLEGRIAELGESNAQVIQSRDHYKRMTEEGLKQLAESRTVTVKLPRPGFVTISGERTAVYLKADVDAVLAAAGIGEAE